MFKWKLRTRTGNPHPLSGILALADHHEPIIDYFDHDISNAYTEALNGLIKTAQRNARGGCSFEVLRTKALETVVSRARSPI